MSLWSIPFIVTLLCLYASMQHHSAGRETDAAYWALVATPIALIALVFAIVDRRNV